MYFKGQGKQRKILRRASPDPGNREGRIQTQNGIYSIISPKYIQLYEWNRLNQNVSYSPGKNVISDPTPLAQKI